MTIPWIQLLYFAVDYVQVFFRSFIVFYGLVTDGTDVFTPFPVRTDIILYKNVDT
jgi:hypothetical protein